MFIITNRALNNDKDDAEAFGSLPNAKGPNELRIAEAKQEAGGSWKLRVLPDYIDDTMAAEVGLPAPNGAIDGASGSILASQYLARKIRLRIQPPPGQKQGRQVLFFVHGYNNDIKSVLDRAASLRDTYDVEVIAFSWPANGGGFRGVTSYKSDKNDAKISIGAFNRVVEKLHQILVSINQDWVRQVEYHAEQKFGNNAELWDRFVTHSLSLKCPFTVNLLLHSMGNYLFKHFMLSTTYSNDLVAFDNMILVAADTNNEGHAAWVDRIQCRGRVYITINERDAALRASRLKLGEQQKARLGHFPYSLNASRAHYVDFTNAKSVGDSHAYFEGEAIENKAVRTFFQRAFSGEYAENGLKYDVARNLYRV